MGFFKQLKSATFKHTKTKTTAQLHFQMNVQKDKKKKSNRRCHDDSQSTVFQSENPSCGLVCLFEYQNKVPAAAASSCNTSTAAWATLVHSLIWSEPPEDQIFVVFYILTLIPNYFYSSTQKLHLFTQLDTFVFFC